MPTVLKYFLFLSKSRKQIPGFKSILLSFHRLPWFGISLGKSALRSFLRREQWILPSPLNDIKLLEDHKKIEFVESRGTLYELLAALEISYDEFQNLADPSSKAQKSLSIKTLCYRKELAELSHFFKISHGLVPQGFFLDAYEISRLCFSLKIPCLIIENTFLHDRVLVEPTDENYFIGKGLLTRTKNFRPVQKLTQNQIDNLVEEHLSRPKSDQHRTGGGKIPNHLNNFVLFLGQVYTDASLLFNQCSYSKNSIELMREIIVLSKSLGKPIVLKLHPNEHHGIDPVHFRPYDNLTHRKLLDAGISESPNDGIFIDFEDRWSTFELMQNASLAITINSQSGFEAMLLGKEVISCGNSYYENLQSCISARDKSTLSSTMEKVLINGVKTNDQSECWNFFDYIRDDYFIKKHPTNIFSKIDRRLKDNFYYN